MKWVALFSQTGSELRQIIELTNIYPDLILTNNKALDYKSHEEIEALLMKMKPALITLHGYLRILSPEVCARHRIINGHPAPIHLFPGLKGKDPQVRAFNNYEVIGAVLHEVIPEVDEGEIIAYTQSSSLPNTLDELYTQLKNMSVMMWCNFLSKELRELK